MAKLFSPNKKEFKTKGEEITYKLLENAPNTKSWK